MKHLDAIALADALRNAHPAFCCEVWPWAGNGPGEAPLFAVTVTVKHQPMARLILSTTPSEWRLSAHDTNS